VAVSSDLHWVANQVGHFLEPPGDGLASFEGAAMQAPEPSSLSQIMFEESLDTNLSQVAALAS